MSTLDSLLNYAIQRVPRYKGLRPDLEGFPLSNKRAILADVPANISDELGPEKDRLVYFLFDETQHSDTKYESIYNAHIIVEETSGSTGTPFRIPKTIAERSHLASGIWNNRRKFDPGLRPSQFYPFIHEPLNFVAKGNPYIYSPQNLGALYEALSEAGIRWVHGEPQLFHWHARQLSPDIAKRKTVRFAESSGRHISGEYREIIETKLNVSLIDQYGCREAWVIGTRNHDGPFEVLAENVVVELVDASGRRIEEPDCTGRIVVTCLHQRLFPFIRYDTGDMGRWEGHVGQTLRLLELREHNILRLENTEVNGNEFFRIMLAMAYSSVGHINLAYVQVRQKAATEFIFATSPSPKAQQLCEAVESASKLQSGFPAEARFDLHQLLDDEVAKELNNKPTLFTTKFMWSNLSP